MSALRILVLHDGKPGHYSQALGLARLIAGRVPGGARLIAVRARPRVKLLNHLLRALAAMAFPQAWRAVLLGYRCEALPDSAPDVVVSFGGNVLALNVALSRQWGCQNIAIGNCYRLPAHCFSAHVSAFPSTSSELAWRERNVPSRVALCKTDRQRNQDLGNGLWEQASGPLWALLIGGDGSGIHYSEADWHALGRMLVHLARRQGVQWLVSTSRRSPAAAVKVLQHYLNEQNCLSAVFYKGPDSPSADAFLGAAERVFCTEDSLSMLNEAVAMNKPVVSLRPASAVLKGTHLRSLSYLESMGLIERCSIGQGAAYEPSPFAPLRSYEQHLDEMFERLRARLRFDAASPALPAQLPLAAKAEAV